MSIKQDFPGTSPRNQNTFNLLPTGFASDYAPEYPNLEKKYLDQITSSVSQKPSRTLVWLGIKRIALQTNE